VPGRKWFLSLLFLLFWMSHNYIAQCYITCYESHILSTLRYEVMLLNSHSLVYVICFLQKIIYLFWNHNASSSSYIFIVYLSTVKLFSFSISEKFSVYGYGLVKLSKWHENDLILSSERHWEVPIVFLFQMTQKGDF
jgi:hypothetical protein